MRHVGEELTSTVALSNREHTLLGDKHAEEGNLREKEKSSAGEKRAERGRMHRQLLLADDNFWANAFKVAGPLSCLSLPPQNLEEGGRTPGLLGECGSSTVQVTRRREGRGEGEGGRRRRRREGARPEASPSRVVQQLLPSLSRIQTSAWRGRRQREKEEGR